MLKLCNRCSRRLLSSPSYFQNNNASYFAAVPSDAAWGKAFSDAEKIVGYPTSFMSLRCLLSDELSNVALHLRKLVGTKHPLLKTAKRFIYDGTHTLQTRGLLVLLISKAAGPAKTSPSGEILETMVAGIYQSQRMLAEIAEMIHTAYLVHRGVVNLSSVHPQDGPLKVMEFGNKMAVLTGDFLLANASTSLAKLHNTMVVEVVSSAIQDLMCSEFSVFRSVDGHPQLPQGVATMEQWEQQTFLASGSLLAKSCQGAMMLAGHVESTQTQAFQFGRYMAYTYQMREDLDILENRKTDAVSAMSAPAILHLSLHQNDASLKKILTDSRQNKAKIYRHLKSSGTVEEAKKRCQHYGECALESLIGFQPSEAKDALENIVRAIIR